jgi:hypothetical protein
MENLIEASVTEVSAARIPAPTNAEPDIMSGSAEWQGMDNEALADFVIEGVKRMRPTAEAILDLRKRFTKLRGKATIHGYGKGQWTNFCKERLDMTDRHARRVIKATGQENPAAKHDGSARRNEWKMTIDDQDLYEVLAAVQGEIRRGLEYKATQHAMQMEGKANHRSAIWNRLEGSAAEDVGPANGNAVGKIAEYRAAYDKARHTNNPKKPETLFLVLAVAYLCRSPKSRIVDNLIHAIRGEKKLGIVPPPEPSRTGTLEEPPVINVDDVQVPALKVVPIPDFCLDKHSAKGKSMKRGMQHFHDVKAQLVNCTLDDPYKERARTVDIAIEKEEQQEKKKKDRTK